MGRVIENWARWRCARQGCIQSAHDRRLALRDPAHPTTRNIPLSRSGRLKPSPAPRGGLLKNDYQR